MENSKIPLSKWFIAIYLCTAQLSRDLGIGQKGAWFMLMRIRETLRKKTPKLLGGVIEADESFVGGKNKNRHSDKKVKESQGRSVKDKTPVFGLVERGGELKTKVVPDTKARTLKPLVTELVKDGSIVITDEWKSYHGLKKNYKHEVIKHKDGEFVRGNLHTNTIESFWALLKRGIFGIYHSASPKHLHRYCDEFSYRYNTRQIADPDRFVSSLTNVEGRLTYKQLTQ